MATKAGIWLVLALLTVLTAANKLQAQGPALTTISDTVYRADGSGASGTALISWPSFQTANGDAVAAGNLAVTIGPEGAFSVQLTPNVGATPAGTYYVVVLQLDDGSVRTEYWAVPTTSPTTIAAVLTTPGTGLGNLAATQQYVNAAVANLAVNATVVHLAGTETITGAKQFSVPPSLPAPVGANDGANKGYVDTAVSNVGSGAYVAISGGTMTGPLTLPADPTAPNQAADRHYVDSGLLAKADLVSGVVPPGELGAGVASSATCLTGNSTWGACGGGAPAGITYATTALNWTQTISSAITGGTQATITLTPCPIGIDTTSGAGYQVLLSGGGNSEAVNVVTAAGGCTSGAASGTITFTPFYSYAAGYTVGSASSGIQETLNAGCGVDPTSWKNSQCNVTIPANGPGYPTHSLTTYNIYGTIYLHSNQSVLNGYGTSLNCLGRGACLQIGDLNNSNDFGNNTVAGLSFRTPVSQAGNAAYAGVAIAQTQRTGQVATITTASAHGFRVGDMVTILFTDNSAYWGDATVTAAPSATTFQYSHSGGDIAAQASPGVVALAYVAVLDNAMNSHLIDISYDLVGENGSFNNFFDFWDDENATVDHFNNNAIALNRSITWTGSFLFSAGNQSHQVAPVITLRDSTITANSSNGVTDYNSNGLYIENTVLQATGPWQVYSSNSTGSYQGAYLKNIYSESSNAMNPLTPARSPFPGLGVAGLIAGESTGAASIQVAGSGAPSGEFATGGTGTTAYSYFIVANDTTAGTQTSPMQALNWSSTGSDSIPVRWPRVANGTDVITYDVIRMTTPIGVGAVYPYNGGCLGGAGGTCGYVAEGLTQLAACSGGLVCSYTDNGASVTGAYSIKQGDYAGNLVFWPGSEVSVDKTIKADVEQTGIVGVGLNGNPLQAATECSSYGAASPGGYTSCLESTTTQNNSVPNQTATMLSDGNETSLNNSILPKGRLNFTSTAYVTVAPHHIITLIDSQPALTQSTWGYRPPASVNDTWIGTDVTAGAGLNAGQLAFGAPVSITNYIGQTGDGIHANWLERLNASLKEFNVPVKFDQSVTLAGLSNGCLNIQSGAIASTGSPCGSGGGGSVSSVFGRTGAVVASSGDYSVAQVTGAAADSAVVHLANAETITGAKSFTSNVTMSGNLILPQGSGYVPAVGGIGLDTAAGLPVVNIGGTTEQVALTSSNISGQAGTALAFAATPTQCSGSFATGIAANGNANCTTPDVIQLAETTPPAGIPNWGVFWFDSTHHAPFFIDNDGQAVQLGLTNLFNTDPGGDVADNLEERNGSNAQSLRVYSSYTNNTTWTRMSLGYDSASGYQALRSEDATSGNALGLGMYIGSSVKWAFGPTGMLKPNSDNSYDIGSDTGQAMRSVFAKMSFNIYAQGRQDFEFANDGTNGTTVNELAIYNSGATGVETAATTSTDGVVGIVSGGAGTTGKAVITWAGFAGCNFDAANPIAGDYAIASTTQAGKCHDTGSTTRPTGVQAIGRIEGGGVRVSLGPPSGSGGGGAVTSVFGRTGAVAAATGDYSVSQVTGAATDSAVVHLAGTETITGSKTFASDVTLSGNLNVAGNINQTNAGPTQWSGNEWTGTTVTVPSGMAFSLGVGSDNTFKCQLASGVSCMAAGAVTSVFGRTGAVVAASGDYTATMIGLGNVTNNAQTQAAIMPNTAPSAGQFPVGNSGGTAYAPQSLSGDCTLASTGVITCTKTNGTAFGTGATATIANYVPTATTVNGHALSANVTISASDLTTGTLPHAELPALVSGDIPNNAANTTGTAANLSGTPVLPNGTTATTQNVGDNSAKLATDAYVASSVISGATQFVPFAGYSTSNQAVFPTSGSTAAVWQFTVPFAVTTTKVSYKAGTTADNTANTYEIGVYNSSGALVLSYQAAGTSFAPTASTIYRQSWSQGATTLGPGKYYLALSSGCTSSCATFYASGGTTVTYYSNTAASSVASGGTLASSITAPGTGFESFSANALSVIFE
jgi:hypothetical protein